MEVGSGVFTRHHVYVNNKRQAVVKDPFAWVKSRINAGDTVQQKGYPVQSYDEFMADQAKTTAWFAAE